MDPKVVQFLYFNAAVIAILVIYMLLGRSKRNPARLKLRQSSGRDKLQDQAAANSGAKSGSRAQAAQGAGRGERELNVIFQFNGHDFDAHEVLGVPAGSSREAIEKVYYELLASSDHDSHEFYRIAFDAICRK